MTTRCSKDHNHLANPRKSKCNECDAPLQKLCSVCKTFFSYTSIAKHEKRCAQEMLMETEKVLRNLEKKKRKRQRVIDVDEEKGQLEVGSSNVANKNGDDGGEMEDGEEELTTTKLWKFEWLDFEERSDEERIPLHVAVAEGNLEEARILLKNGRGVWEGTLKGYYPLHVASMEGHPDCVDLLLKHGAKITAKSRDGSQALHLAAENGRLECIEVLINRGADVNEWFEGRDYKHQSFAGGTALHFATKNGYSDCLKLLLDKGANKDELFKKRNGLDGSLLHGGTALHLATATDNSDCVTVLLERNADIGILDDDGSTPLYIAAQFAEAKCLKVFLDLCILDINEKNRAFRVAAKRGYSRSLELFLQHGVDVNTRDSQNRTALHLVIERFDDELYRVGCVKLLLLHKADIDAQDKSGQTPLMYLFKASNIDLIDDTLETIKFLLASGANVNKQDNLGKTPLMHLLKCAIRTKKMAECLVSHGASVDLQDAHGQSATHIAAKAGDKKWMTFCYKQRANIHLCDKDGMTAIQLFQIVKKND